MQAREEGGTVRAVERALVIVELLGEHGALGLEELHYLTSLPKATVSRLLHTLQEQGWLYRGLCDRRYRLSSRRLFGDANERSSRRLVEEAAPLLKELSERTGLVVDLSFFNGTDLHVVESSIPEPLRKRYPSNRLIMGLKASLFHSAMGQACLTVLDEQHVRDLAEHHAVQGERLLKLHEQAHHRGFGERTEGHWEYAVRLPFLIRAIALPVQSGERVLGAVALHWPQDQSSVEQVRRQHLGSLGETVEQLQRGLA